MRVAVDDQRCRGHGMCLSLCPEVFTLTDGGYAVAVESEISVALHDAVQEAVDNCPEKALTTS